MSSSESHRPSVDDHGDWLLHMAARWLFVGLCFGVLLGACVVSLVRG